MAKSKLEKYIRRDVVDRITPVKSPHPELKYPTLILKSGEDYGDKNIRLDWVAVPVPFEMIKEHHKHDHDQFLLFVGGDLTNMPDLGGEVELTLSEDGKNLEKFVFTTATWVYIPRGLYHCPLNFKKVNDPKKPILFHDFFFASEYSGKIPVKR
jgi:hypothetical protein